MMTIGAFLRSSSLLIAMMAALAIVETALPFSRKDWRRRHAIPNLLLSAVTLCLNFVFNAGAVLVTSMLSARHFGAISTDRLSPAAGVALSVVALDACTYIGHRLMHV